MNQQLHKELSDILYAYLQKYTLILQKEIDLVGLSPIKQLEKEVTFMKKLLSLQLETKYFNCFK